MVKAKDLLKKSKEDEIDEDVLEEEKDSDEEEEELSASAKKYEPEEDEVEEKEDEKEEEDDEESDDDSDEDKEDDEEESDEDEKEALEDKEDEKEEEDIEPVRTPGGKIAMTEEDEEKVREVVNEGVDLDKEFDRPIKEEKSFSQMREDAEEKEERLDPLPEEIEEKRSSSLKEQSFDDLTEEDQPLKRRDNLEEETFPSSTARPSASSGYFRENAEELPKEDSQIPHLGSMRSSNMSNPNIYAGNRGGGNERSSSSNKWHVLILLIIGIAVIGATVYLLKGNIGMPAFLQAEATPSPTPVTETIVETPTPTPGPTITRADYKVRVLNGTSTSGLAGTTSTKLKDLGYQIDRTGNATNSAFTQTMVRVKEGSSSAALLEQLIKDLAPDFSGVASTVLRSADAADAEIILGK